MDNLVLDLSFQPRAEQADGQPCFACDEKMFLTAHRLWITVGEDHGYYPTQMIICPSCFDEEDWT